MRQYRFCPHEALQSTQIESSSEGFSRDIARKFENFSFRFALRIDEYWKLFVIQISTDKSIDWSIFQSGGICCWISVWISFKHETLCFLSHRLDVFQSLLPPVLLFCLCKTSNQADLLWLCLSSGIFILVFATLWARTARTNLKHQQTKCLSIYLSSCTPHSAATLT